jgi:hypothetical protein
VRKPIIAAVAAVGIGAALYGAAIPIAVPAHASVCDKLSELENPGGCTMCIKANGYGMGIAGCGASPEQLQAAGAPAPQQQPPPPQNGCTVQGNGPLLKECPLSPAPPAADPCKEPVLGEYCDHPVQIPVQGH